VSLAHHGNAQLQYQQQYENAKNYIIPLIEQHQVLTEKTQVMDIGCGEGGVLAAFIEKGCYGLGVDLNPKRIEDAAQFQAAAIQQGKLQFIAKNIYDFTAEQYHQWDIIVFKDSIEHIPEQAQIIAHCKKFLKPNGMIFFGFPAWRMPFGGHQQILPSKFWSLLPYYHLLPMPLYAACIRMATKEPDYLRELLEIKKLGLSTLRFEKIVRDTGYRIVQKQFWLINPIYSVKFGLKPKLLPKWLEKIGFLRDFFITTAYYLIQPQS